MYNDYTISPNNEILGENMNDRKQHVIKMAHQLFIEKGFQSSSIQDILEYSGISKGTFYNYFSSKNELLMAIIKSVYKQMQKENAELLICQDHSDISIFIKQIEQQVKINQKNRLFSLIEEVIESNDEELNQFIKEWQLKFLEWIYGRFLDIFSENKQPYLLDCAIMFMGILQYNLKFYQMAHGSQTATIQVVKYSVERIKNIVEETSEAGEQLIPPVFMERMLSGPQKKNYDKQRKLHHIVSELKKCCANEREFEELLDFFEEELIHSRSPRKFLIDSVLLSLRTCKKPVDLQRVQELEEIAGAFFL
jgi:AcrR family transcriptional regulator